LAADQGYAFAQYNIGVCYGSGRGVVQDNAEAVRWYQLARGARRPTARECAVNLGVHYSQPRIGDGFDLAEAARWFRLAAGQGHERAQAVLASLQEL
jgi:TPR repeat protein